MTTNRRTFVKNIAAVSTTIGLGGLALGLSPKSYARVIGANDRVNMGIIGVKSRGRHLTNVFRNAKGTHISAICDVDSRALEATTQMVMDEAGYLPAKEHDMRRLFENKAIDAVCIATPDHWHAPGSIMAMEAGKHVYVEKPLSHNPKEGEWMIQAQKKYSRVVQMGNQQRSSDESSEIIKEIHNGIIGEVYKAYTWYANTRGTIGKGNVMAAPDWLNWDLWQGPAPRHDYQDNLVHYNWHWFWNWGTGETCNNATHEVDVARWALGVDFPKKVKVNGARHFFINDDWEMYDTMESTFIFPEEKTIIWDGQSCNGQKQFGRGRGVLVYGTKGSVIIDRNGYLLFDISGKLVKEVTASEQSATTDLVGGGSLDDKHIHNFLETIRGNSDKQNSPVTEGHKSVLLCHLANIAYRTGSDLDCDPQNGYILNNDQAMNYWERNYESGWKPTI